ncbi:aldo/keto reductase [Streptomyces sp. DSM 44915]|uniref:Aldo/keto reductase n=1 Tax=Streptomyces chisholmiae TaxID=3075540 RepID=A0ABU2K0J9_9ACTN|nr:aldo/keto reductase [Streptomyces sp. DSM 44915]MDT0270781.1 aldo/keto reductase [Streptomyces sp. DSM 44915]
MSATALPVFAIAGDLPVGRLGLGAMRLPTEPGPDRERSLAVARAAVAAGVTLIDTAYLYGGGANEELLVEALHPYADGLLVTTKVGVARDRETGEWHLDGRPATLREQVDAALYRLRMDRLELLQLHRVDPEVPLAEQVGTLAELRAAGKIGRIGLSEVTVAELAEARGIVSIASVQNRYNLLDREHEPVLAACEAAGIAFLPWRPVAPAATGTPPELAAVADEVHATPAQVALAWLLAHSPVICPIPGTASLEHLHQNIAAAALTLTPTHRTRLDHLQPSTSER